MADSERRFNRALYRSVWSKIFKIRPKLVLCRRDRLRLRAPGRCERHRRRRRLLQAQAAHEGCRERCGAGVRGGAGVRDGAAGEKPEAGAAGEKPEAEAARRPQAASPSPARDAYHARPLSVREKRRAPQVRQLGPGCTLLLLPVEDEFTFGGTCRLTCLYGEVEVFGYAIRQGQPPQDLFSTFTHAFLNITAVRYSMPQKTKKETKKEFRALVRSRLNLEDRSWSIKNFSPLCSLVMLEQLKNSTVNFITSFPGLSCVFMQESGPLQINSESLALRSVGIRKEKKKRSLTLTESVHSALRELVSVAEEEMDDCLVVLVCGAQDVGKSTFNKFLINQLLNRIPCVDYLECDLGQTEFTPPGCISLLNITEPVLGPPFTHQRTPQKMVYFGKPSCRNSCENYIEIIKYVFSAYKRESPLIINTMGWVVDDGLLLLIDLIRLLAPSYVVQFTTAHTRNMPVLTPEFVEGTDGLYTKSKSRHRNRCFEFPDLGDNLEFTDEEKDGPVFLNGHKLLYVQSEFIFCKTLRNRESHNRVLRGLAVLGYLSLLMPSVPKPPSFLPSLTPYQVPFNSVAIRITHSDVPPTHILYAVNASWVGLCRIMDDIRGYTRGPILLAQTPICDCVGFGICRGVDMEKRVYHILTPVPPEELKTVNCLLIGSVNIPPCIFCAQRGLEGTIPYITTDYNFNLPGASEKIGLRTFTEAEGFQIDPTFCRKTK
ncbi:PREDICTED: polynucleotide 5'-hydroxyl-kinase NOL9 [Dipodomys ordii]|uniref:Polynucleotide 5'-hydroxyl-kinase NOL9 n=1 Tax=Dipodomys ordii TaxID=10020 RepID=A0A1S3GEG8_DIPOR|nr:PREDICTED: polynucleotide 5'-hydroxyl-kinase NOL9 [Dipodomys ordii]